MFDFLIGTLWNRFLPVQQPTVEAISTLLKTYPQLKLKEKFQTHVKSISWAVCIFNTNEALYEFACHEGQDQLELIDHFHLCMKVIGRDLSIEATQTFLVDSYKQFMEKEYFSLFNQGQRTEK